ncbi:MAG: hypothetical protein CO108_02630 [Deltaproteobacteria bacterium CG_4_9_14_3_um_filter_63_12]|nr:MAG: hypothetical protein CO108_02630 [Deltaproteobacteria bacterium CG_4_9_14_3_um_filter_63_12]
MKKRRFDNDMLIAQTSQGVGMPQLGFGVGLRAPHYDTILRDAPEIDLFEITSESYLATRGKPLWFLDQIAERYPMVMHGQALNIASVDPIDFDYLRELKALAKRVSAHWISDHLCWTGTRQKSSHDLLPLPYNERTLHYLVERIAIVQDFLERPLVLENPATYLEFYESNMTEWDFLRRLSKRSKCKLLLDLNSLYISCYNHGWDSDNYLQGLPFDQVIQYHLGGHQNFGTHIIGTHAAPVAKQVWTLYEKVLRIGGNRTTVVQWDTDIPDLETVHAQALEAKSRWNMLVSYADAETFEGVD